MIDARQVAFGGGGKRLPYDAEVEYLESTGTQWIDTGIYVDNNIVVEGSIIVGDYTTFTTPRIILATDYTGTGYEFRIREPKDASRNTLQVMCGAWWTTNPYSGSLNAGSIASFRFDRGNRDFIVNGLHVTAPTPLDYSQYRILVGHSMAKGYDTYPSSKIRTIKLYIGDNLVRDFIPVRVGDVGYMYDKVSGELFGNSGTGNFILGDDL